MYLNIVIPFIISLHPNLLILKSTYVNRSIANAQCAVFLYPVIDVINHPVIGSGSA